jgi:hypothetical protein
MLLYSCARNGYVYQQRLLQRAFARRIGTGKAVRCPDESFL